MYVRVSVCVDTILRLTADEAAITPFTSWCIWNRVIVSCYDQREREREREGEALEIWPFTIECLVSQGLYFIFLTLSLFDHRLPCLRIMF